MGSATAFAPSTFGVSPRQSIAVRSNFLEEAVGSDYFDDYDFSTLDAQVSIMEAKSELF